MHKNKTAGQLSLQAASDTTKYSALEVGHALVDDVNAQLDLCIETHNKIFDEDEYCVCFVLAGDPLIKNVMRRKFYAWPYLPKPRPNQAVFLYNKRQDKIVKRLWVLPNALTMAELSELSYVHPKYQTMQAWSIAFFKGTFWDYIRFEHDITMPSESEYLKANREKLIKAGCKQVDSSYSEPFDFSKISVDQIVDTNTAAFG